MALNRVVVKYLDGRMLKGTTLDFAPTKDTFHLDVVQTNEEDGRLDEREVDISELKAVFFVKDFAGRPEYKERDEFLPGDEKRGRRVIVVFPDGETLNALSVGRADRTRKGFFVNPVDPESNNIRIFVISSTVKEIREPFLEERDRIPSANKVVVRYQDGRILKGTTLNFDPFTGGFYLDCLETNEEDGRLGLRDIVISELKAVFFVKDFAGRPEYREKEELLPDDSRSGGKLTIEFRDGEKMNVLSMGFGRSPRGFFVNPVDPESNNIRIFVVWTAVKHIRDIPTKRKGDGLVFNKVIAKYLDGRILKGSTLNFDPTVHFFHLDVIQTNEEGGVLGVREVDISQLKAIFFVKDFAGRPEYEEREEIPDMEKRTKKITLTYRDVEVEGYLYSFAPFRDKKMVIKFQDGERLKVVYTGFDRAKKGFFVNPVDPESNNIRIFIISDTVKSIEVIP